MELAFVTLLIDYWPAVLFVAFGGWLIRGGATRRYEGNSARNAADAKKHGLNYAAPKGEGPGRGDCPGTHRFSGTDRGVVWTMDVTRLQSEIDDGLVTRSDVDIQYTRWTASEAGTGIGSLVLMALPDGVSPPLVEEPTSGLFGELASKAAWAALQVYIHGAFGAERARTLLLGPQHRLSPSEHQTQSTWIAFGDRPELLTCFTPSVFAHLRSSQFGPGALLWDTHGLTVSWPIALLQPEAIETCAEHCVALALELDKTELIKGLP